MNTVVIRSGELSPAVEILRRGGLVAVPTETVYGLSADGLNGEAVAAIYAVKGRPAEKPVSLLVAGMEQAESVCREIPREAYVLAAAFWPGPLTMVLKKRPCVPDIVTAGGDTVGVRCPDHPVTLALLRQWGGPLATPSANPSDLPSPKNAGQVLAYFDGKIPCVIDGGPCAVGVESTIVDLTGPTPRILRQGGLPRDRIRQVLNKEVL
jgi:tRNA threonylcarbamoyl adenosine modification protein (Sua5/YciO/YrdC/YwlC family)